MTAIVGICCEGGAVIGTDSSATFGPHPQAPTVEQPVKKLHVIGGSVIVAGTGFIGLGQRFCAVVWNAWNDSVFDMKNELDIARELCKSAVTDFRETNAPAGHFGALVAYPIKKEAQLCEFQITDFQPELKKDRLWFCSMGSAQSITDPFLALMREVFWQDTCPSIQEGIFAATWALDHAIQVNPGGVNGPIQMAILEPGRKQGSRAWLLDDGELEEHRQNIEAAKEALRALRDEHLGIGKTAAVDIPKL